MDRTKDIGWDKNPRALPARVTAQASIVCGILLMIIGGTVVVLALSTNYLATLETRTPWWVVGGGLTLAGIAAIVGSLILLRRVARRDEVRAQSRSVTPGAR